VAVSSSENVYVYLFQHNTVSIQKNLIARVTGHPSENYVCCIIWLCPKILLRGMSLWNDDNAV